jgi:hypothetical protein
MSTLQQIEEMTPERQAAEGVRATAEELAQALGEIERRRAREQQRQADTIALAEAIRQLDLDVTQEELAAEVLAARRRARETATPRRTELWQAVLQAAFCLSLLFNLALVAVIQGGSSRPNEAVAAASPTVAAIPDFPVLSQLPENSAAYLDFYTLKKVAEGQRPETVRVDARQDVSARQMWQIVRRGGQTRVRAYAGEQDALRIANGQSGVVYTTSMPHGLADLSLTPMEVPIYRFRRATEEVSAEGPQGRRAVIGANLAGLEGAAPR